MDTEWTECKDNIRESKMYWDKRIQDNYDKPYHGMFFDSPDLIERMDVRNFIVLSEAICKLEDKYGKKIDILEAGCGSGRYISTLLPNVNSYTGFDFATLNVEDAKKQYPDNPKVSLHELSMEEAPSFFSDRRYHLIFMVSTLTSIQRNFNTILKGLQTLLHHGENIYVFEQDMSIKYWGDWKLL